MSASRSMISPEFIERLNSSSSYQFLFPNCEYFSGWIPKCTPNYRYWDTKFTKWYLITQVNHTPEEHMKRFHGTWALLFSSPHCLVKAFVAFCLRSLWKTSILCMMLPFFSSIHNSRIVCHFLLVRSLWVFTHLRTLLHFHLSIAVYAWFGCES